jgi:hypothetical protein
LERREEVGTEKQIRCVKNSANSGDYKGGRLNEIIIIKFF